MILVGGFGPRFGELMSTALYKITNTVNKKSYIGVSKDPQKRISVHLNGHGSKKLAEDIPSGMFQSEVLAIGTYRYIYDLEQKAISLYNSLHPHGYNIGLGGEGGNLSNRSGSNNTATFLVEDDIIKIREEAFSGALHKNIAEKYGLSRETISYIVRGDSWKEVGGPLSRRRVVTEQDIKDMQTLKKLGLSNKKITEALGWSASTVWKYTK